MNVVTMVARVSSSHLQESMCIAQDATFELMDALLLTRKAQSLADLSLSCVFRRQWSSVYEALQDTRPDRQQLMKLYIAQIPQSEPIVLAGDHTRKVETVCQNPSRAHLRTFPIPIGRSSGDARDMVTVPRQGYLKHRGVGQCHCYTKELPVGTVRFLKQSSNYRV